MSRRLRLLAWNIRQGGGSRLPAIAGRRGRGTTRRARHYQKGKAAGSGAERRAIHSFGGARRPPRAKLVAIGTKKSDKWRSPDRKAGDVG
jgi:hypothetical protein